VINSVVLVGRLTRDPELKYTPNGKPYCSFTVAVDRPFTDENGERETDFIRVVSWNKTAENMKNYLIKGSLVGVTGRIQVRSYEKDDRTVWMTEVVASRVDFLDYRKNEENKGEEVTK